MIAIRSQELEQAQPEKQVYLYILWYLAWVRSFAGTSESSLRKPVPSVP